MVAFIPAAILGFLFSDKIDEMLESVAIVAVMLVIGGIFMLFCDKIFSKGSEDTVLTEKKKGIQYRFVSMYCNDTGSIPFDGYHCRRYGPEADS